MLLNSLMEDKDKSSINFKCVSISLLKRCSFKAAETQVLLEPHSSLLLNIIENETDLSLRMLAAEVLPHITSTKNLRQVLNQMKSKLLSLNDSKDDRLISKTLSNNLLDLLAQKSENETFRLIESIELLLLIREQIEPTHLYKLLNLVCKKNQLQDLAVDTVLQSLSKGFAMNGFVLVSWYILGEFGQKIFNSPSPYFEEFLSHLKRNSETDKQLRMIIISAVAKLWVKGEFINSGVDQALFQKFKSKAQVLLRGFLTHQDLETQTRASQFLFILQNNSLSESDKLEIFKSMPCQMKSQDFDLLDISEIPHKSHHQPMIDEGDNLLDMNFSMPNESAHQHATMEDPLDLFSESLTHTEHPKSNFPPKAGQDLNIINLGYQPETPTNDGLDLFLGNPPEPVKTQEKETKSNFKKFTVENSKGYDMFDSMASDLNNIRKNSAPKKVNKPPANEGFDDLDLLSMGIDMSKPKTNQTETQKSEIDLDFL